MRRGALIIAASVLTAGCSLYEVVPDRLEGQVREDVRYEAVQADPGAYEGETVAWGGEILKVTRRGHKTEVEILQLPLDRTLRPIIEEAASRGRFVAVDSYEDIDNPSLLEEGTLVTVIGEVQGVVTRPMDHDRYQAPELIIRDMTAWERKSGITHYPMTSPLRGYRPFVFWDRQRVVSE